MKQQERKSIPERLGRWAGRAWRGYARREARVLQWSVSKGVPAFFTLMLMWTLKLVALAAALYLMFWFAFGTVLVIAGLRIIANSDVDVGEPETEWRDGLSGYGLYDDKGVRIDPYDPDEDI
jgi:hypothetical protein